GCAEVVGIRCHGALVCYRVAGLAACAPGCAVFGNSRHQPVDTNPRRGAQGDAPDPTTAPLPGIPGLHSTAIDLVVNENHGNVARADLGEHPLDLRDLVDAVGRRGIDHVQQQVRLGGFLERRLEGVDELVREVPDEADRIGQHDEIARRQPDPARERVEGCEQPLGRVGPGPGQAVEQGRLAGVGIADDRYLEGLVAIARAPAVAPLAADALEICAQPAHPGAELAAVEFDLLLARPAANPDAPALPLEVGPAANQAGRGMFEPRELHLELAFVTAGAAPEDVEDQLGAIEHRYAPALAKVALLHRAQFMVEQHQTGIGRRQVGADLVRLARADIQGGIGTLAAADVATDHAETRRFGQRGEFVEALLVRNRRSECYPYEQAAEFIT